MLESKEVSPWIDTLPPTCQSRIAGLGRVEAVEAGARIIQRGQMETHLYLIESGSVTVADSPGAGHELTTGDLVGEMAFLDNAPRRCDVFAACASQLRRIDRVELVNAFASDPVDLNVLLTSLDQLRNKRLSGSRETADIATSCVAELAEQSLRHRATHHPYLVALNEGTLPDARWALADFARQYFAYSSHFPRYLTTVISRLENPAHRRALLENLSEESGSYDEEEYGELAAHGVEREWIQGIAHPILFQRFARAMGVEPGTAPEADQVVCWRDSFLQLLANGTPAEALGAIGLGTENIVRTIYGPFVTALRGLGDLAPRDTVFFPLHTAVDDHHQATIQSISADFAMTESGRVELRRGMLKSLQLRCAFWDWMLARALHPAAAEAVL
jgi:hypothetical protein